jgi:hypothetical protein
VKSTQILTVAFAAAILLSMAPFGIAKQGDNDAAHSISAFPSGKYYVTVSDALNAETGARDVSMIDPELVQIGDRHFVVGTVCDASYGARRSEFCGQKAFVALKAIISIQRYPEKN